MEGENSGNRKRGMTPLNAVLVAGVPKPWDISGDWFHVATAPVNDLMVRFDDSAPVPMSEGMGMRRYYDRVAIESATGQTVVVFGGFGSVQDGRATVNANITSTVEPGNAFDDGGDVAVPDSAATQILAAGADRVYARVALPSDAIGPVRIGTSGVDLTSGDLLEPGMSIPIAVTAALYAYHENGADTTVIVSAVRQV